jgi:hypothetical protein
MTKTLGTILTTSDDWKIIERVAAKDKRDQQSIVKGKLSQYVERFVEGETRYYDGENRYAIVGINLRVLWFEQKEDGYCYACKGLK